MARATSIFYTAKSVRRQPTFSPLDKSRRTFLGAFLTMIVLTSTCAVFYISTHVQAVNLGYKLSLELAKKESLIEENKRLDLEIARLKSPTRIEEEAKEVFGLVLPKTQQVYYLSRWDEELNVRLAAAAEKIPVKDPANKAVAEKTVAKAPAKAASDGSKAEAAVAKPKADEKTLAKAPSKPAADSPKPEVSAAKPASPEKIIAKAASKPTAGAPKPEASSAKATSAKAETPAKLAKAAATKPAANEAKIESAKAPTKAAAIPVAAKLPPKPALKAAPSPGQEPKYADVRPEAPKKSETVKSDLPAVKPAPSKTLAQNSAAALKPNKTAASVPATAKNEPVKPTKATATKPSAETKLAKKEDVLVARIVEKAPVTEKLAKPKPGPALAYQPKEKVPAVMLDPMP